MTPNVKKRLELYTNRSKESGQNWNRTSDTRIFSPLLYRLSYLAKKKGKTYSMELFFRNNNRTDSDELAMATALRYKDTNVFRQCDQKNHLRLRRIVRSHICVQDQILQRGDE